jgi:hypothetical protein
VRAYLLALVLAQVACGRVVLQGTDTRGSDASDESAALADASTNGDGSPTADGDEGTDTRPEDASLEGRAGPNDAMPEGDSPCIAQSCSALGYECGIENDGCGRARDCGTCQYPMYCGGGGFSKCGGSGPIAMSCPMSLCVPQTCGQLGYDCGPASDGCGNQIDCGPCPFSESCSIARCVWPADAGPCVPATCQGLGYQCGSTSDGCGGRLECGTCPVSQFCGGGGVRRCGGTCLPPDSGISWVDQCQLACSSADGGACVGVSCLGHGHACGYVPNGCGGLVDCGACGGDAGATDADTTDAASE